MCGFTGTISLQKVNDKKIEEANKLIECRGPIVRAQYRKK